MASITFLINTCVLIWTLTTFEFDHGVAKVFAGDCHQTETLNTWIHLAINALSTILLSGSNYCMQILSAPTRKEIDEAHAKTKWLDIGVPSVRNLRAVATRKVVMWWLLGLSSVPLHLMYNSVFFSTIATNEYNVVFAYERFIEGGPQGLYNKTRFTHIEDIQAQAKTWDRLEPDVCINSYATEFLNTRRNLVAVISPKTNPDGTPLRSGSGNGSVEQVISNTFRFDNQKLNTSAFYGWICGASDVESRYGLDKSEMRQRHTCSLIVPKIRAHSDRWNSNGWDIKYCLSELVEGKCSLNFSLSIVVIVMICNVGKSLLMFLVAFGIKDNPLITIGDAIDSFLNSNDPTTGGMCLISKEAIKADECEHYHRGLTDFNEEAFSGKKGYSLFIDGNAGPIQYQSSAKRWLNAASGPRWCGCALLSVPKHVS